MTIYAYDPDARQWEALQTSFKSHEDEAREARVRPFRFEDLEGKPEPASWGPFYPKTLGAGVEKWRKLDKKRELTKDETRQWGAAVGEAIRKLNRPAKCGPISLHCTVVNTSKGRCNTAEGEAARYQAYVDRLNAERLARRAADPLWLDKKIAAAFEREFAWEYRDHRDQAAIAIAAKRKPSKRRTLSKAA